jgi:hypothetical protein
VGYDCRTRFERVRLGVKVSEKKYEKPLDKCPLLDYTYVSAVRFSIGRDGPARAPLPELTSSSETRSKSTRSGLLDVDAASSVRSLNSVWCRFSNIRGSGWPGARLPLRQGSPRCVCQAVVPRR